MKGNKMIKQQLILVRGLPGSGKSTLAKQLLKCHEDYRHYEADMFLLDGAGEYRYDQQKIFEAHEWCKYKTTVGIIDGLSVVVSNTFTTLKEMRPYFQLAATYEIIPTILIMQNNFGNVHNVPEETLIKMKNRFCFDVSPLINEFQMPLINGAV